MALTASVPPRASQRVAVFHPGAAGKQWYAPVGWAGRRRPVGAGPLYGCSYLREQRRRRGSAGPRPGRTGAYTKLAEVESGANVADPYSELLATSYLDAGREGDSTRKRPWNERWLEQDRRVQASTGTVVQLGDDAEEPRVPAAGAVAVADDLARGEPLASGPRPQARLDGGRQRGRHRRPVEPLGAQLGIPAVGVAGDARHALEDAAAEVGVAGRVRPHDDVAAGGRHAPA